MLNYIWLGLVVAAVLIAGGKDIGAEGYPAMKAVTEAAVSSAKTAVELSIGLVGVMALWLGLMRIAEKGGLVQALAWCVRPLMRWLFPKVPSDHPAMGAMVMNIAANMLGLANAATPLGIKAMEELDKLNPRKGTATNAMCTFLAINTSSVQLVPSTVVAIMASAGAKDSTAVIGTAFAATCVSTAVGITAVKLLEKMPWNQKTDPEQPGTEVPDVKEENV
jgi:spore maturation protein A